MNRFFRSIIFFWFVCGGGLSTVFSGDITGTVTDAVTGEAIVGLDMNIYDSDWVFLDDNALTVAGGFYRFSNIPEGEYYVRANPKYPFRYQHKFWQNASNRDDAITVMVPVVGDVTDIDFALDEGWYIVGKVSELQSGIVLEAVNIRVYTPNWVRMDVISETDQYGRYYIGGLPGGDYYVMADTAYPQPHVDQYFDHSAGPINAILVSLVPPDDLLGISFDLDSGSYILGAITDKLTNEPLQGIRVRAYNDSGNVMRISDFSETDGRYVLGAYREGEYYVRADPSYPRGYMDQYYPEAFQMADAERVSVTLPKPVFSVNIALSAGSYMRGTLTNDAGLALPNVKMKFYDRDWTYLELVTTYTKEDGKYLSGALKPGMYYVKAVPIYPQPWIDEYYPDSVSQSGAELIPIALASETTGVDLALEPGGYLVGTITHLTTGEPLQGVDLDVYDANWDWVSYSAHSKSNGSFILGALPYSSYYLHADPYLDQGYVSQFYDKTFMPSDATLIPISDSQNPGNVDFILDDGGFISGTVTHAVTELPLPNIEISILSDTQTILPVHTIKTNSSGQYTAYGIPAGACFVGASLDTDDDYQAQYYQNAVNFAEAIPVEVIQLQTISGINFALDDDVKPTPTPAVSLGVTLEMPSDMFHYQDIFYLNARIANPGQLIDNVPLFIILDIVGEMFFWPSWAEMSSGIDFQLIQLETGVRIYPILPVFEWPRVKGSLDGIHFYGGMTRPDFSRLLGDMDTVTFGYSDSSEFIPIRTIE